MTVRATNPDQTADKFMDLMGWLQRLEPGNAPPKEAEIPAEQLALIYHTTSNSGFSVQTIAAKLNLATPTVSISVRQLEKSGFMER